MGINLQLIELPQPDAFSGAVIEHIDDTNNELAALMLQRFVSRKDRVGDAKKLSVEVSGRQEILERLEKHLAGERRLGLYGLLPDGTVQWAMVEFENHGDKAEDDIWLRDALKYQSWLADRGNPSVIERSKNRNGQCYHLHITFDQPLPSYDIVEGLTGLGKYLFDEFPNEVFPKSEVGLGLMVWLPLYGGKDTWGLGVNETRTVFIDENGEPFENQADVLANWATAESIQFSDTIQRFLPSPAERKQRRIHGTYLPPEELNTKEELNRMLKFDPFIQWCQEQASKGLPEPLWHAMISNLCRFEGGSELIHEISEQDPHPGRYEPDETDAKIERALISSGPMGYEEIVRRGWPGVSPRAPFSPAGWAKLGKKGKSGSQYIGWDDEIITDVDGTWTAVKLSELKAKLVNSHGKLRAVCPECDTENAAVKQDENSFSYIWCDNCQKPFYESPVMPDMYVYRNKVLRVESRSNKFISLEALDKESFRTDGDYTYAKRRLLNDPGRKFLEANFQIRRIGNADIGQLRYDVEMHDNAILFQYPALPVQVKDNAFIDDFLDRTFESYSNFIKDWLAMYSYTNYTMLPVIVLTGERSCGKGTFGNMVGAIFPSLMGLWEGTKERFNEYYKNKLLFVDENANSDKPMQYVEIKKITGNKILRIDEKFIPPYNTPNNLSIIITTNDAKPIFLKAKEEPKSENTNNFFIHRVPNVEAKDINEELGTMLEERLGYYVRTELKERFDRLMATRGKNNRYGIPAPITPLTRQLFVSAPSNTEMEAEELARHLVFGVDLPNPKSNYAPNIKFMAFTYNDTQYVQFQEIRGLISQLGFTGSPGSPKSYVTVLQQQGVLSYEQDHIASRHLGYRILRNRDYYTTTVSGILPVADDKNDVLEFSNSDFHHSPKSSILSVLDTPDDKNDEDDTL